MAIDVASLSASRQILDRVLLGTWNELLYYLQLTSHFPQGAWGVSSNPPIHFRSKCVVARVVVFSHERDERWESLAIDRLGISRSVLQIYPAHGDSVSHLYYPEDLPLPLRKWGLAFTNIRNSV